MTDNELINAIKDKPEVLDKIFKKYNGRRLIHCPHCNKIMAKRNFYQARMNFIYRDYLPVCKKCLKKLFTLYFLEFKYDEYKAMEKICQLFDLYFDENIVASTKNEDTIVGEYMRMLNLSQHKYKSYGDTVISHLADDMRGTKDE